MGWMQDIISLQREIYLAFANQITAFANGGGWSAFLIYLPMGILFGAAHALTPGHSKTILATYLAGSPLGLFRGLSVSFALSFTHVTMSVLIALLSLPLVSLSLGSVGRAPMLEDISRGLLGLIGVWMLYRAFRRKPHTHDHGEGMVVGFMAGLVPCPLTLFVMTFAISRGVPEAGVAFAVTMMMGVALTLSTVAAATVLFRQRMVHLIESRAELLDRSTRAIEGIAGLALTAVALRELIAR
ncbi:nickel/cobalt transporter [Ancylobacter sp. IITR112]|uniref:nickel/cobalt transporter n=1 Tax=Ancylobacter sp. IITR112 TaxID=3138073 RepID=UPI00352B70A8